MTERLDESPAGPSRRIVFQGLAALGVAAALAGCGSGGSDDESPADAKSSGDASGSPSSSAGSGDSAGQALVASKDVPVGGGVILTDAKIVVTQPTAGTFEAFTAVCTHQGFTVTSVQDDTIVCNHHGSRFSAKNGSVINGPATAALAKVDVVVKGGQVLTAA